MPKPEAPSPTSTPGEWPFTFRPINSPLPEGTEINFAELFPYGC